MHAYQPSLIKELTSSLPHLLAIFPVHISKPANLARSFVKTRSNKTALTEFQPEQGFYLVILHNLASNTCHPAPVKHVTITSYPAADRISASSVRTESKRSKSYERWLPCYRQWQRKWLNEFKGTNSASALREYPGVFQREVSYWDRRFQIPKSVFSSDRGDRYSFNGQIASTLQNTFFSRTRVATKKLLINTQVCLEYSVAKCLSRWTWV